MTQMTRRVRFRYDPRDTELPEKLAIMRKHVRLWMCKYGVTSPESKKALAEWREVFLELRDQEFAREIENAMQNGLQ